MAIYIEINIERDLHVCVHACLSMCAYTVIALLRKQHQIMVFQVSLMKSGISSFSWGNISSPPHGKQVSTEKGGRLQQGGMVLLQQLDWLGDQLHEAFNQTSIQAKQ